MKTYYLNQSLTIELTISIDSGQGLNGATKVEICYKNPSGMEGIWDASHDGLIIKSIIPSGILNELGNYTIWPKVTFGEGSIFFGSPSIFTISQPGTVEKSSIIILS